MFDHRFSLFFLLAWLLVKSVAPAFFPEPPVLPAGTGVQPIEVEPEKAR